MKNREKASLSLLDTSFDGKESYRLEIRPLTKERAFAEYRNSGGETLVWDEMEKNMPYVVPEPEGLNVMILRFGRSIGDDKVLAEMDKLGVCPLTYEELIQYGIARPEHQRQRTLVGLGTKHAFGYCLYAPTLSFTDGTRTMIACCGDWGDRYRFPVVRK